MCAALSNRKTTIDSLLSEGDLVAVRSSMEREVFRNIPRNSGHG